MPNNLSFNTARQQSVIQPQPKTSSTPQLQRSSSLPQPKTSSTPQLQRSSSLPQPRTSDKPQRDLSPPKQFNSSDGFSTKQSAPNNTQPTKTDKPESKQSEPKGPEKACETTSSIPTGTPLNVMGVSKYKPSEMPADSKRVGDKNKKYEKAYKEYGKKNKAQFLQYSGSGESAFSKGKNRIQGQAQYEGEANLFKAFFNRTFKSPLGATQMNGQTTVGVNGSTNNEFKASGEDKSFALHSDTNANVGLQANGGIKQTQGKHFSEEVSFDVKGGASASAEGSLVFDPKKGTFMVKAGYSAMAGSEEKVNGEIKLGVIRLSGGISAQQGVNSNFNFGAGINDGRLMLSADVGAALGLGVGANVGLSVNLKAIGNNLYKLEFLQDGAQQTTQKFNHLMQNMKSAFHPSTGTSANQGA